MVALGHTQPVLSTKRQIINIIKSYNEISVTMSQS